MGNLVRLVGVALIAAGCSGPAKTADPQPTAVVEPVEERPAEPPTYVVIHRNAEIRLARGDDAPYLQYRPWERQAELEKRWREEEARRLEAESEARAERKKKEAERQKKLRKRMRKYSRKKREQVREREKERKEKIRYEAAAREIRDIRKRAKKRRGEASDQWWIPFEVVRRDGDWLNVRPVAKNASPRHCFGSNFGDLDRLDATYWVRENDLATVVTRRTVVPVYSGTEVKLLPGVAVTPVEGSSEKPKFRTYVNGFELELPIPSDALGTEYRPENPFEAPVTDTVLTDIAFAEEKLRIGKTERFPYNPFAHLYVTGTLRIDHRFYVTMQTPCGEYTVRASEDLLQPAGRRGPTRLSAESSRVDPPYASTGATAYLRDGAEFGRVLVDFPLGDPQGDDGPRRCWRTAVWGKTDAVVNRSVELCFDPSDIVVE